MKISERTIKQLGEIITGDKALSPYRSGPKLVSFFNDFGTNHACGQGFPSRWAFAEDCLRGFEKLLTIQQVADLLHVPVSWVYGRTRKRSIERLPGIRLGKYWRAASGVAGLCYGSGQRKTNHALMSETLAGRPQAKAIPLNI